MTNRHTPVVNLDETGPLAWERSIAFGLTSSTIGVLGHNALVGAPTDASFLLISIVVATALARILTPLRHGGKLIATALLVLQFVLHITCQAFAALSGSTAAAHESLHSAFIGGSDLYSALLMLSLHIIATVLGTIILLELESYAWSSVTATLKTVSRAVRYLIDRWVKRHQLIDAQRPTIAGVSTAPCFYRPSQLFRANRSQRGPPKARLAH